ncbi:MAG: hypothetical protein J1F01_02240 [Oscillospiraceae bacterium]|nr:hypothetical protein [Oscillospiraceae bacterium]
MKKKILLLVVLVIALLVVLIPERNFYTDGGSVEYVSLIYSVTKHHSIIAEAENSYLVGYTIDVFGFNIYDNTHIIEE